MRTASSPPQQQLADALRLADALPYPICLDQAILILPADPVQ